VTPPLIGRWRVWSLPVAFSILDQGLVSGAHFGLSVLLARWVSPAEYGVFAITFSLFLLLSVFHVALIIEPMNVLGAVRPAEALGRYLGSLVHAHVLLTIPLSVVVTVAAVVLRSRNATLAGSLAGLAAALPFLLLQWLLRQACYLRTRPDLAARGSLVYLSTLAVCLGLLAHRPTVVSPLMAAFPSLALASLVASVVLWRPLGMTLSREAFPTREVLASHWSYGRWIVGAGLAHNAGNALYLPLVAAILGLASSGTLKALQNLGLPLQQLLTALSLLALPWVSRQAAARGEAHSRRARVRLVLVFVCVAMGYGAVLVGFGGTLLRLLYGPGSYSALGANVFLVALAGVAAAAAQALGLALRALGRPQPILWSKLAVAVFVLAGGTVLVEKSGLYGALLGIVLGHACETVVLATFLRSRR
jgi:O-antigen/teichoic acid export membrane protein